jgi:antitoxin (DNA-binding transcriptional repressor) of toxin-antitoxin stability system
MLITVGARELKNKLGTYLRLVRGGARVIVTERGRPVAELRALVPEASDVEVRLQRLAADGLVTPPSRPDLAPRPRPAPTEAGSELSAAVIEDRADRL